LVRNKQVSRRCKRKTRSWNKQKGSKQEELNRMKLSRESERKAVGLEGKDRKQEETEQE
jgi:hypothetical protein